MDLVKAFAREAVAEGAYTFKRAVEEGISPGFLGVVLSENLELVVPVLLARAREVGEAYCPECGEYRNLVGATRFGDMARCPRCGTGLRADHCALCGEGLHDPETGAWHGVRVVGFSVCSGCEARARRVLRLSRGGKGA